MTAGPRLQTLLGNLHGHHQIEDHHYFPVFRQAEPRLAAGFGLLANDHVAREWRLTSGSSATARFPLPADVAATRLSIVAWLQEGDGPAPVQAVKLPLGQCKG